jgi:hypothetical protein
MAKVGRDRAIRLRDDQAFPAFIKFAIVFTGTLSTSRALTVAVLLAYAFESLGDPMADFTYLLMQWVMPGLEGADFMALNLPTMKEAEDIYCKASGRSSTLDLNWYFAFNLFRFASILQGIAKRNKDGTAASAKAAESAARIVPLAQAAWSYAQNLTS